MGNHLTRLTKWCCNDIQYNKQNIVVAGNGIALFDRYSQKQIFSFSSPKNISCIGIDDKYIYTRNTEGVYYIFDCIKGFRVCRCKIKGIANISFDNTFLISHEEHCIIDVLMFNDNFYYFTKFYPETCEYKTIKLVSYPNLVLTDIYYVDEQKEAYVLFNETCCLNKDSTTSKLFVINTETMQISLSTDINCKHGLWPLAIISNELIMFNDITIFNYKSLKIKPIKDLTQQLFVGEGYLRTISIQKNNKIAFICSNSIYVYDLSDEQVTHSFKGKHYLAFKLVDNVAWIGTWNGTLVHNAEIESAKTACTGNGECTGDGSVCSVD